MDTARDVDTATLPALRTEGSDGWAQQPTPDDVTILLDGRRLDTPEKVRAYVAQFIAERHTDVR